MKVIKIKPLEDAPGVWEDDEDSWYEDLYCSIYDEEYRVLEEKWSREPFKVGDIVMVKYSKQSSSGSNFVSPHRVFVISAEVNKDGEQKYVGFEMSSQITRSNKYVLNSATKPNGDWWKANIYIDKYSDIVADGTQSDREAMIDLGTLYWFTNNEMSKAGVKKGTSKKEFSDFVFSLRDKVAKGEDISHYTWENGEGKERL